MSPSASPIPANSPASIVQAPRPIAARLLRFWFSDLGLAVGLAGILAGYFIGISQFYPMVWMLVVFVPACISRLACGGLREAWRDKAVRLTGAYLLYNFCLGALRHPALLASGKPLEYAFGAVLLLPLFILGIWMLAARSDKLEKIGAVVVAAGTIAAVVSVIVWYTSEFGTRLRSPLFNGGLHPVSTGLTFACAGMWAAVLWNRPNWLGWRLALLVALVVIFYAVMLTLCRGALLASGVGFLVFLIVRRGRGAWQPCVAAGVAFGMFLMTARAVADREQALRDQSLGDPTLTTNPAREWLERNDSGRGTFYKIGLSQLDTWPKKLIGIGMWVGEKELDRRIGFPMGHFHSLFLSTYVHGGIIGLGLLVSLIGVALLRAWKLARCGQAMWLVLLSFGLSAVVFDGQSAGSMLTYVLYEPLILWVPLVGACGSWIKLQSGLSCAADPVGQTLGNSNHEK